MLIKYHLQFSCESSLRSIGKTAFNDIIKQIRISKERRKNKFCFWLAIFRIILIFLKIKTNPDILFIARFKKALFHILIIKKHLKNWTKICETLILITVNNFFHCWGWIKTMMFFSDWVMLGVSLMLIRLTATYLFAKNSLCLFTPSLHFIEFDDWSNCFYKLYNL